MSFAVSIGLVNLILYCVQQLGMTLGVGAETVFLAVYLHSIRDRIVDEQEKGFGAAVRKVLYFGLFLIIASGIGVILAEYASGGATSFSTIFLFKWCLIGGVLFLAFVNRSMSLFSGIMQGVAAATWYALFVVHILVPQAGWVELGEFYGAWVLGFLLCWTALVFSMRGSAPYTRPPRAIDKFVPKPSVIITPKPSSSVALAAPTRHWMWRLGSLFKRKPAVKLPPSPASPGVTADLKSRPSVAIAPPIAQLNSKTPSGAPPIKEKEEDSLMLTATETPPAPPPSPLTPLEVHTPVAPSAPVSPQSANQGLPPPPPTPSAPVQTSQQGGMPFGLHVMPHSIEEVEKHKAGVRT